MFTVYVLQSIRDNDLYIGCTGDLAARIQHHNAGRVRSTKSRLPFRLVYTEEYSDKYEAFRIEKFYKTAKGEKVLKRKINYSGIV